MSATWSAPTGSLLGRAQPGSVYNAASGRTVSIQEIIAGFLACVTRLIDVHQVAQRIRPVDIPLLGTRRLRVLTGWSLAILLRQSLEDVLNDWRSRG